MTIKFANNISTTLALGAGIAATSFDVVSTTGFPVLGSGDYFYGTLANTLGAVEIVQVTGWTGTTVTCVRGAEGTPPQAWSTGDAFEIRVTAAGLTTVLNATEVVEEVQTATSGQTVFTLTTFMYVPGENTLSVYVDGVNQIVDLSYTETGTTTVTFISGLHLGALVKFTTLRTSGLTTSAAVVTYEPAGTGAVATTVQAKLRESVSVLDFGAVGDGTNHDTEILAAWNYCLANGKDLYFPAGTYSVGASNFPFSNPVNTSLLDCGYITVFGDGPATILKTVSVNGADVLQLNALKNLTIRDLQVTATVSGSVTGSNGISITNGFDNLNLFEIYCLNLPRLDKGAGVIEGGGALSIQTPSPGQVTICGSLTARIHANGCYYGFLISGDVDLLQSLGNKQAITVDLLAENCGLGVFDGSVVSATYPALGTTTGIVIKATTVDCQIDYFAPVQSVGSDVTVKVVTSKTKAARLLNPQGVRWDASTVAITDTGLYSPGQLCLAGFIARAHNCTVKLTGDKGACDYKAVIGASASGTGNATTDTSIYLDIGGTAATANVIQLVVSARCLSYSTVQVSDTTATLAQLRTNAPYFFLANQFNRILASNQTFAESGTWTPTLNDSIGPGVGVGYDSQVGNYFVVNGWVHFELSLIVNSLGSMTVANDAYVGGLPYVSSTLSVCSCSIGNVSGMTLPATSIPSALIGSSAQAIRLYTFTAAGNTIPMKISDFSATGNISVSGTYKSNM